jgi:hypothetical protein
MRVVLKEGPNSAFRRIVFFGADEGGNLRGRAIAGTGCIRTWFS